MQGLLSFYVLKKMDRSRERFTSYRPCGTLPSACDEWSGFLLMANSFGQACRALIVGGAVFFALSAPGEAQTIVGGVEKPAVEVNQSELDRLGAPPSLSDLYLNRPSGVGRDPSSSVILKHPSRSSSVVRPQKPDGAPPAKPRPPSVAAKPSEEGRRGKPVPETATSLAKAPPAPPESEAGQKGGDAKAPPAQDNARPEPVGKDLPVPPEAPVASASPERPPIIEAPPVAPGKAVGSDKPVQSRGGGLVLGGMAPAGDGSWSGVGAPLRNSDAGSGAAVASPEARAQKPETPSVPAKGPVEASSAPAQFVSVGGEKSSVVFTANAADISAESQAVLADVAQKMGDEPDRMVLLQAFASANGESASRARHISLSRALAVRSKLIELGVRSTRIEVRALGDKTEGGNPERVDLIFQKRDKG